MLCSGCTGARKLRTGWPAGAADGINIQQMLVEPLQHAFRIGPALAKAIEVGNRKHGQGTWRVELLNRRFKGIGRFIVAIIRDQQQLFVLALPPNLQIGRGGREADILEMKKNEAEVYPELAPRVGAHLADEIVYGAARVDVSQDSLHRSSPDVAFRGALSIAPCSPPAFLRTRGNVVAAA